MQNPQLTTLRLETRQRYLLSLFLSNAIYILEILAITVITEKEKNRNKDWKEETNCFYLYTHDHVHGNTEESMQEIH